MHCLDALLWGIVILFGAGCAGIVVAIVRDAIAARRSMRGDGD